MVLFSGSWSIDLLMLFISIFTLLFWFLKQRYTYWERRGFKSYPKPNILFGHFGPTFAQKQFIGELVAGLYKNVNEAFIGVYLFVWPKLLICDSELAHNILIKDGSRIVCTKNSLINLS